MANVLTLIEHNGERQLVDPSHVEHYSGCTILETGVPRPLHPYYKREEGKWVEDTTAKQRAEERAAVAEERARLLNMEPELRQREAIDAAKEELLQGLITAGVVSTTKAEDIRRGWGNGNT